MSLKSLVTGVIVGAAVGGGVAWALLSPRADDLSGQIDDLEAEVLDARHAAGEMKAVAEAERLRTASARRQLEEIRNVRGAKAPVPGAMKHGPGANRDKPEAVQLPEDPKDWDLKALRTALEGMARRPRMQRATNAQYKKVMRAVELLGDDALKLLGELIASTGQRTALKQCAAGLAGAMKLEALAGPLRTAYDGETNPKVRRSMLSALGKLPGDGQVELMLGVFRDESEGADKLSRHIAISSLARSAHPVAIQVAEGEIATTPQMRARAAEALYTIVRDGGFEDATLLPVFCKILETADGDAQRGYALAAAEGLWSKDCLPSVKVMLAKEGLGDALRGRAEKLVAGLESGAERPDEAGGFDRGESKGGGRRPRRRQGTTTPAPDAEKPDAKKPDSGGE